ncbi:Oxysterol-binding protein-related protein 11, partial [Sarcoptes scabiei]
NHKTRLDQIIMVLDDEDQQPPKTLSTIAKENSIRSSSKELLNATKLTDEELDHLCSRFEEENRIFQGLLYKYTNVVKGWQYRWFIVHISNSYLEYFLPEDRKIPRGFYNLKNCQIIPSDEDSQTFTIHHITDDREILKLKASDAKDRQIWVDNLRLAVMRNDNVPLVAKGNNNSNLNQSNDFTNDPNDNQNQGIFTNSPLNSDLLHSFDSIRTQLSVEENHRLIVNMIEDLTNTDEDLLILKANSSAAVQSLERCLTAIEKL